MRKLVLYSFSLSSFWTFSFYTAHENNTIFYMFSLSGRKLQPFPLWTALCNFTSSSVGKGERRNVHLVVEICGYLPQVCTFVDQSEFKEIFRKPVKNSIYHWDFCNKLLKFSQNMQILISFSPKSAKMCRPAHFCACWPLDLWRLPCRPVY